VICALVCAPFAIYILFLLTIYGIFFASILTLTVIISLSTLLLFLGKKIGFLTW
jgi:hypothetical protein